MLKSYLMDTMAGSSFIQTFILMVMREESTIGIDRRQHFMNLKNVTRERMANYLICTVIPKNYQKRILCVQEPTELPLRKQKT